MARARRSGRGWGALALGLGALLLLGAVVAWLADTGADGPDDDEEDEVVQTLHINSELVDCEGVAPQRCMQVRRSPDEPWQLFYDQIDGFTFEPGFTYELRVRVDRVEPAPADASSLRYALVEVVDKAPAA